MKPQTLVYYEQKSAPAIVLAKELRTGLNSVVVREARRHLGEEREVCERVIVMPDVTPECRKELYRLFEHKVEDYHIPVTESVTETKPDRPFTGARQKKLRLQPHKE